MRAHSIYVKWPVRFKNHRCYSNMYSYMSQWQFNFWFIFYCWKLLFSRLVNVKSVMKQPILSLFASILHVILYNRYNRPKVSEPCLALQIFFFTFFLVTKSEMGRNVNFTDFSGTHSQRSLGQTLRNLFGPNHEIIWQIIRVSVG